MILLDAKLGTRWSPVVFPLRVAMESQTGSRRESWSPAERSRGAGPAVPPAGWSGALWPRRRSLLRFPLASVISWTGLIFLFFFFKASDVFWYSARGNYVAFEIAEF